MIYEKMMPIIFIIIFMTLLPSLCVRILWTLCPIPVGFSGTLPRICPENPTGIGHKCGGFLPVLRFPALQTGVPQGMVIGTWRGVVGDGAAVVHAASFRLLLVR